MILELSKYCLTIGKENYKIDSKDLSFYVYEFIVIS